MQPFPGKPSEAKENIDRFRDKIGGNLMNANQFILHDLEKVREGIDKLIEIRQQWEDSGSQPEDETEVQMAVYPALTEDNKMEFYYMPLWAKKGSLNPGGSTPMENVWDFPHWIGRDGGPYSTDEIYIFDMGTSVP